jgi:hypothetical protein
MEYVASGCSVFMDMISAQGHGQEERVGGLVMCAKRRVF